MQEEFREGVAPGPTRSSQRTLGSHDKFFRLFAVEVGADEAALGDLCSENVLRLFLWYVANVPRETAKRNRGTGDSVEYALSVVSSLRAAAVRRGGWQVGTERILEKKSVRTRVAVAMLLREGSQPREGRRPIQSKHLF